ncbi:MAG: hypothetical protein ACM3JC_00480 [Rudaea sp.]
MTEEKQGVSPSDSVRRKLVRGAFATPAILTLYSGGARAATSANVCLVNANNAPASAPSPSSTDDAWFRYRLWVIRHNGNDNIVSSWIKGADLTVWNTTFISSGQWWQFNVATNQLSGTATTVAPTPGGGEYGPVQTGSYVVLRVDASGNIVGAGAGTAGAPVGDSCWGSFAVAPA